MPPHPGPVVAIDALGANTGRVLGLGFVLGLPVAALAGPVFARWVVNRVPVVVPELRIVAGPPPAAPSVAATLFIVVLPIALMLLATAAELLLPAGHGARAALTFIGHPVVALAIAFLLAAAVFRRACGFSRGQLLGFTEESVAGIGMTLLVVGGGGGFARVLREAGISQALSELAGQWHLPPLLYGWLLAAFIRVATGSATVAITAAAGVLAPFVQANPAIDRELLVLAIGSGSLFLSHLNDGGFWIVKESLGFTVGQTLRTWTITECLIGVFGLGGVVLLDLFLKA
jgi:GntP family gluconate:H+ symporter